MEQNKAVSVKIRVLDKHVEDLIDELVKLPEYKSKVSLFSDAVRVGIPILYEDIFGEVKVKDDGIESKMFDKEVGEDLVLDRIIELLQEINMNVVVARSTCASIFNLMNKVVSDKELARRYKEGELSDTPEYLKDYEDYILRDLDKE